MLRKISPKSNVVYLLQTRRARNVRFVYACIKSPIKCVRLISTRFYNVSHSAQWLYSKSIIFLLRRYYLVICSTVYSSRYKSRWKEICVRVSCVFRFMADSAALLRSRKYRATRYIAPRDKPEAFLSRRSLTRTTGDRKSVCFYSHAENGRCVWRDIVSGAIIRILFKFTFSRPNLHTLESVYSLNHRACTRISPTEINNAYSAVQNATFRVIASLRRLDVSPSVIKNSHCTHNARIMSPRAVSSLPVSLLHMFYFSRYSEIFLLIAFSLSVCLTKTFRNRAFANSID